MENDSCRQFEALNFEQWPTRDDLKLDEYQYFAFRSALTQKMTLIQGPPGTGKTFLGVKIVKTLLQNKLGNSRPIIISCYTNHALDQFLERLLVYTKKIIRIGEQGECSALEPHRLSKLKNAIYQARETGPSSLMDPKKKDSLLSQSFAITELISPHLYRCMPQMDLTAVKLRESCHKMNYFINTLNICVNHFMGNKGLNTIVDSECKRSLSKNFSEQPNVIMCKWLNIKDSSKAFDICQKKWETISKLEKEDVILYQEKTEKFIWQLPIEQRYQLFCHWRDMCIGDLSFDIATENTEYKNLLAEYERTFSEDELSLLGNADIVGLTMTGAARFHEAFRMIEPRIMIIEEAAEALEAHLITSVVPSIEQLILIGDHKQLRPIPATHVLEKEYNLHISLFERMFENGAPSSSLVTQHRMRPCIADLLVPEIYPVLKSYTNVHQYESIRGSCHDLFFFKHDQQEDVRTGSSVTNKFEATFIINLAHYFLQQDYKPSQITVLAMYSAQVFLLQKMATSKQMGILVTTVDNYQGEENDIILISFVRSNFDNNIGFLKELNRVCVALSRARKGLYCIGNFQMLSNRLQFFQNTVEKLTVYERIGTTFPLKCPVHERRICISNAEEFHAFLEKGCESLCNSKLQCGHYCTRKCHFNDIDHVVYKCYERCKKLLSVSSDLTAKPKQCKRYCWQPCEAKKEKILLPCGHKVSVKTSGDVSDIKCPVKRQRMLKCNHIGEVPCSGNLEEAVCNALIPIPQDCGHTKMVRCPDTRNPEMKILCEESRPVDSPCGHTVYVPCHKTLDAYNLMTQCERPCDVLLSCGHSCLGKCSRCSSIGIHAICGYECKLNLSCGHPCMGLCGAPCSSCESRCFLGCIHQKCCNPCLRPCLACHKPCPRQCVHRSCTRSCSEICEVEPCIEQCTKVLLCGHQCIGLCGDQCSYICRICNADELDCKNPNSDLFVMLEDCNHIVEVNMLTSHIEESLSTFIWPRCPQCDQVITMSRRYSDQLKKLKSILVEQSNLNDDKVDLLYKFRILFGIDNKVNFSFLPIQKKMKIILERRILTEAILTIMKAYVEALQDLISCQERLEQHPHLQNKFESIVTWMYDHLEEVSFQQLNDLESVIENFKISFDLKDT